MKNFKQTKRFVILTKSSVNLFTVVFAFIILLQSCSKIPHDNPNQFKEDKLLLSKVSGTVSSVDPEFWPVLFNSFYTYSWNSDPSLLGANTGNFQVNYTYGKNKDGWEDCKPLTKETFLNGGYYHFLYNDLLPNKVVDSSITGNDVGYWKFYFNHKEKVEKVGLGFTQSADPLQFELYNYDNKNRLDSFIYELAPDSSSPAFKVVYQYNQDNDLTGYQLYYIYPVSSDLKGTNSSNNLTIKVAESAKQKIYQRPLVSQNASKQQNYSALTANSSNSFYDVLYLTATITTDGKVNPFRQQGHILFYQTNRYFSINDPTPFFLSLLKSNPVKVEYTRPAFGGDPSVQTFSYTYNSKGYPITVHEGMADPGLAFAGTYIKDSQIEYIKNE